MTSSRSHSWYVIAKCFKLYLSNSQESAVLTFVFCQSTFSLISPMVSITLYFQVFKDLHNWHCPVTEVSTKPSEAERGQWKPSHQPPSSLPSFRDSIYLCSSYLEKETPLPYPSDWYLQKERAATETQSWSIKRAPSRGSDDHAQWKSFLLKAKRGRN